MKSRTSRFLFATSVASTLMCAVPAFAVVVNSTDVPKAIISLSTITSVLTGPDLIISDLNLEFGSVVHRCIADLHIELTSPAGTTSLIMESYVNNGILFGQGCRSNFIDTVLDDQAAKNLRPGAQAPWTGSFNVAHASVATNPLAAFNGENAAGTWTLLIRDDHASDDGSLDNWGINFAGVTAVSEPETVVLLGLSMFAIWARRRRRGPA